MLSRRRFDLRVLRAGPSVARVLEAVIADGLRPERPPPGPSAQAAAAAAGRGAPESYYVQSGPVLRVLREALAAAGGGALSELPCLVVLNPQVAHVRARALPALVHARALRGARAVGSPRRRPGRVRLP